MRRIGTVALVAAVVVSVGACRQEERDRPLSFDKGNYAGPKGAELNEEQIRKLRQRHRGQAGGGL